MPLSEAELAELEALELAELEELEALEQAAQPAAREYDPTTDMSAVERFLAGIGSGMTKVGRRVGNLAVKSMNYSPLGGALSKLRGEDFFVPVGAISDEAIAEQKALDAPLSDTTGGKVGQFVGELAATLPAGFAATPVRGAGAAYRAAGGTNALTRALTSRPAAAALEGAVGAAMSSDVGDLGGDAAMGAGLSGALSALGGVGGRLTRGLVKKSQAADDLIHMARQMGEEIDLPLAAAASDQDLVSRLGKTLYQDILPLVPGAGGRLEGQMDDAMATFRNLALKEASPEGFSLPDDIGRNANQAVSKLKRAFDRKYEGTVKKFDFSIPDDFRKRVAQRISSQVKNVDDVSLNKAATSVDQLMARYSNNSKRIEGENLLDVKNEISDLIRKARGKEKQALIAAQAEVEDMIQRRLKTQGLLDEYLEISEPYANFKAASKAIRAASGDKGNFTPKQLARVAPESSSLKVLAEAAQDTLGSKGAPSSVRARMLAGLGGVGYGYFVDPVTAGGALAGGNLLATKGAQRALLGDLDAQRAMVEILRNNPKKMEWLGRTPRLAIATQVGDDEDG
jgi:hypothetical protein